MTRIPALTFSLCCLLFVGCEANPPSPPSRAPATTSPSGPAPASASNTPSDAARSAAPRASGAPSAAPACPPPRQTTDPCAAVMTYVKVGGICCAYGTPCEAPPGQTFSDSACTKPNPH